MRLPTGGWSFRCGRICVRSTSRRRPCRREPEQTVAYAVKEIFLTLQGEGAQAGRAAVFCRFTGCNLWSGREVDRSKAVCKFCDTDFVGTDGPGGGKFETPNSLAKAIDEKWIGQSGRKFVVITGGEPLLQLDSDLLAA